MNKNGLVQLVASELNVSRTDAARMVESVIRCIAEGVNKDEKVALSGFGTFRKKHRKARTAMNPLTQREMKIKASKTVGFSPSRNLREKL
ncbi:MAG: HU family DNA-binding protein [Phycisphaerales bacterium]